MSKVTSYTSSSNETIDKITARKDLFYRVRNSGTYGSPVYSASPATSARKSTAEQLVEGLPVPQLKKLSLTAAQIKTLQSIPIEIVAAPGSGFFINVLSASIKYTYGTAVFASDTIDIYTSGDSSRHLQSPSFLSAAASVWKKMWHIEGDEDIVAENTAIKVRANADSPSGDGTAVIYLTYEILPV